MVKSYTTYGIDAPRVVRDLLIKSLLLFITGYLVKFSSVWVTYEVLNLLVRIAAWLLIISAITCLVPACFMIISSLWGKRVQARRLIDMLAVKGNEKVLDAGCGRGLLIAEVAQRLTTGKVIGIDIWNRRDLSNNTKTAAQENIQNQGVMERAEIVDGDIRHLPFTNNSFDCIVSSMVVHNIAQRVEREKALVELIRVLKPGGRMFIQDFQYTHQYEEFFKSKGLLEVKRSGLLWLLFPPVRVVSARKPIK